MNSENYEHFDNESLAAMIHNAEDERKDISQKINKMKFVLQRRMESNNQKVYPSDIYNIELDIESGGYNYQSLVPLRENLPPDIVNDFYTPATTKVIDITEKYDARKFTKLKKYGQNIIDIIENAKLPDRVKGVKISRKE